mmetsp:Transcript_42376/g.79001  ORF Transcript_42376/g.79001 Transcript_42376/m.79001 type:complete len:248 (+) Transcript_42376:50-793(+)
MSVQLTLDGVSYSANIEGQLFSNEEQRLLIRKLTKLLLSRGVYLTRMDLQFVPEAKKALLASGPGTLRPSDQEVLRSYYTLPRAALHGLVVSAEQEMAVLGEAYVDPRLGPFARGDDGGALETSCDTLGSYPRWYEIGRSQPGPHEALHTCTADDGTCTNNVMSLFAGSCAWYFGPKEQMTYLQVNCDSLTGWRVVFRGDLPCAYRFGTKTRCLHQAVGPAKWTAQEVKGLEGWPGDWEGSGLGFRS